MDFRTETGYVLTYEADILTGDLTLTFKNKTETTTLGTIQIEPEKLRALCDSLAELVKNIRPDIEPGNWKRRCLFNKNAQWAKTEFDAS